MCFVYENLVSWAKLFKNNSAVLLFYSFKIINFMQNFTTPHKDLINLPHEKIELYVEG